MRVFKIAVMRKKNFGSMTISALQFKKMSNESLLKQCFDFLRKNKEEEKLSKMKTYLYDETRPAIDLLTFQVDSM